jgi:hypothetical protein
MILRNYDSGVFSDMSLGTTLRPDIGNSRINEIGVSMLDTRQLAKGSRSISSRHICTKYRDKSFLFGDSEYRGDHCLPDLIKSLFYIEDTDRSVSIQTPFEYWF